MHLFAKTCIATAVFVSLHVNAANINSSDFSLLRQSVVANGSTPVVVSFFAPSLDEIHKDKSALRDKANSAAKALFSELGDGALAGGRWSNDVGQIGFYINSQGLEKLKVSKNAVTAWSGSPWNSSSHIIDSDGSLEDIDKFLKSNESIEVEVVLNVEGLEYFVGKNGRAVVRNSRQNLQKTLELAGGVIASAEKLRSTSDPRRAKIISDSLSDSGAVVLSLTKSEILELARNPDVRAIKRSGYVNSRAPLVTPDWKAYVQKNGLTEMVVELVSPLNSGRITGKSVANQSSAHSQLAKDVLNDLGFSSKKFQSLNALGILIVSLTEEEVERLVGSKDPRIKAISPNIPIATPKLIFSVDSLNVPKWRNLGYGGAGQTIAVFDIGIDKNHEFMKNAAGVSRVTYEGCFGTNQPGILNYVSPCGDPSTDGDSEDYVPNQGGLLTLSQCGTTADECSHGLMVAGIAAGRRSDGMYGVAPDANIASIKVVTYEQNGYAPITFFNADVLKAANRLATAVQGMPYPVPYTINLSMGGSTVFNGNCDGYVAGFKSAFDALKARGIPVVIATGNNGTGSDSSGSNWGINFPSCISGVTKVSSVNNYTDNITISPFSNYFKTGAPFVGEYQFFAPGNTIYTSKRGGYIGQWGTSFAAPHVAGIYALLKQGYPTQSVDGLSALIAVHSRKFQAQACSSSQSGCAPQEAMSVYMP